MVWSGSDEFEGKWEDDTAHGDGLFTHPAGYERDGEWQQGKPAATARRVEFTPWVPPPTELTLEGAVIALTKPPAAEEGADPDAAPAAAEPPLSSLTLRLTVVGAEENDSPVSASTSLVEPLPQAPPPFAHDALSGSLDALAEDALGGDGMAETIDGSTCEGADTLMLALPENIARPIKLFVELCDPANGGEPVCSAEVALPLSSTGESKGELEALPLGRAGADADALPYACLTITYTAKELDPELEEREKYEPATAESLAELLPDHVKAGQLIPPFSGVLCKTVEVEPPPADESEPPAAAPAKGKGKAEPEPEPEPAGPIIELYPVAAESGRAISVTLVLPEEAHQARIAAFESAAEARLEAFEAEEAAQAEAHAAAVAEAEAAGEPAPEEPPPLEIPVPPPPPESEWALGSILTKHGRVLVRGLAVPLDVPTGPATLLVRESTPPLALFELPHVAEVSIPINLIADGEEEPEPPPADPKGKKK